MSAPGLVTRLNAAIQEARLQKEITTRHAEMLRWTEILWVLEQCRDEISRPAAIAQKRETLHLKAAANG